MSITGAVSELDKEISALNKEINRLTQIRESLLKSPAGESRPNISTAGKTQKRKYVRSAVTPAKTSSPAKKSNTRKKIAPVKASASVKATAPAKKRVVSAATRKKMSDAAKARAAVKSEPAK
ncbi:hypothetical protein [Tunturiibacter gelidiferens]|uniref:Uncharacterized protein n=1 Tax=Tunturiibacter gelidiferens TaxID=3069689 RepID=A0AAU7YZL3_9BACT